MYKTIVLDCQAKVESFNCEDCIAFKECTVLKKRNETLADAMGLKQSSLLYT